MITGLEVRQSLRTHRKVYEAADALDVSPATVIGSLVSLWLWAIDNAPEGRLGSMRDRTIARLAEWDDDAEEFVTALLDNGWLEVGEEGFVLHDWAEHVKPLVDRETSPAPPPAEEPKPAPKPPVTPKPMPEPSPEPAPEMPAKPAPKPAPEPTKEPAAKPAEKSSNEKESGSGSTPEAPENAPEAKNVNTEETSVPDYGRTKQETEQPTAEPDRLTITRIREALKDGPATYEEIKAYLDAENVNTHNLFRSLENNVAKGTIVREEEIYLLPEPEEPAAESSSSASESAPESTPKQPAEAPLSVPEMVVEIVRESSKPLSWKAIAEGLANRGGFVLDADLGRLLRQMVKDGQLADEPGGYALAKEKPAAKSTTKSTAKSTTKPEPKPAEATKDKRPSKEVLVEVILLNPGKTVDVIATIAEDYGFHLPAKNVQGLLDVLVKEGRAATGTQRDKRVLYFATLEPLILDVLRKAKGPVGQPVISRRLGIDGNGSRFREALRGLKLSGEIIQKNTLYELNTEH